MRTLKKFALLLALLPLACNVAEDGAEEVRIVSLGPNVTEILVDLGIEPVAVDENSFDIIDAPLILTWPLEAESVLVHSPTLVLASDIMVTPEINPLAALEDMGIEVVVIPTGNSLNGIEESINLTAAAVGLDGAPLIEEMRASIRETERAIAHISVIERPTVYFEISEAPYMFTFGRAAFLNELLEMGGGVNVFTGEDAWLSVSDEEILYLNPEVILTNISYLDDPIGEIMSRPGWGVLEATQTGRVYQIPANPTSRASNRVSEAVLAIAQALHPDAFEN